MSERDDELHRLCRAGAFEAATELALHDYGPEIYSFLHSRVRNTADAEEAFAIFAEAVWTGLPGFAWRCAPRTWMYTLARNAGMRIAGASHRRRELIPALENALPELIARVRTETASFRRTEMKDRVRALRERIDVEDQTLLTLHVDRGLPWREIAMVMHDDGENLSEDALRAEAARLRKRFERVKSTLRELAIAEGLISGS